MPNPLNFNALYFNVWNRKTNNLSTNYRRSLETYSIVLHSVRWNQSSCDLTTVNNNSLHSFAMFIELIKYDSFLVDMFLHFANSNLVRSDTIALLTYGICVICVKKTICCAFNSFEIEKSFARESGLIDSNRTTASSHFNNIAVNVFSRQLYYISEYSLQFID